MLSRNAWKEACHFRRENPTQVLTAVESAVRASPKPVVLVDLDHTVYRNAPRTRAILRDLLPQLKSQIPAEASALLADLEEPRMGFSLRDTFRMNGLMPEEDRWTQTLLILRKIWWPIFFSDAFLHHDLPYPEAPEFCQRLARAGARLIYLSARNGATMLKGTEANLVRDGFPLRDRSDIWLKHADVSDGLHKTGSVKRAQGLGAVVASFENEPANTVGLWRALPEALHVFLDTVCSEEPAVPLRGLFKISGFV